MRKIFIENFIPYLKDEKIGNKFIIITADMGYGLLDGIRNEFPEQFINVGSAEQLMLGIAAGIAMEGKIPICYSITPFLIYRPFEFIRNFMNHEKLPIKLVGGGRDKDYGYLGSTHHAIEDLDILRQLKNIKTFKPDPNDLEKIIPDFLLSNDPCYLNLIK